MSDCDHPTGRPTRLPLDEPAASAAGRPDRRGVLLAAGAGLLDGSSRQLDRLHLPGAASRSRSRPSRGGWPTSSSACSRCATTSTSAARRPTTSPGTTPPTPRRRCSSSTPHMRTGSPGYAASTRSSGRPIGPNEGPWADYAMSELILHINREVIHHGAEIACIRDLYAPHHQERK